jgi:hypothetical protein
VGCACRQEARTGRVRLRRPTMPGGPNSRGTTRSVPSPIRMVRWQDKRFSPSGIRGRSKGRELVNEDNGLLGHGGLKPLTSEVLGDYGYWEVVAVDNDEHGWIIWSMYDIGGRTFVIPIISQLWYGLRALTAPPYSVLYAFPRAPRVAPHLATLCTRMGSELVATTPRASRTDATAGPV